MDLRRYWFEILLASSGDSQYEIFHSRWKSFTLGFSRSAPTWWEARQPQSKRTRWGMDKGRGQTLWQCPPSSRFDRKWSCQIYPEVPPTNNLTKIKKNLDYRHERIPENPWQLVSRHPLPRRVVRNDVVETSPEKKGNLSRGKNKWLHLVPE